MAIVFSEKMGRMKRDIIRQRWLISARKIKEMVSLAAEAASDSGRRRDQRSEGLFERGRGVWWWVIGCCFTVRNRT